MVFLLFSCIWISELEEDNLSKRDKSIEFILGPTLVFFYSEVSLYTDTTCDTKLYNGHTELR